MPEARRPRVREVAPGVWADRPFLGCDRDGRQIRPYKTFYAESEEDAERQAIEWEAGLTAGGRVRSMALSDLLDARIAGIEASGASPNSVRTYRLYASYARRFFGTRRADRVEPIDVGNFTFYLLTRGSRRGEGLSPTTAAGAFQFLRSSFKQFAVDGLVPRNPTVDVEKPRPSAHEAVALDEADLAALIDYLDAALSGAADGWERHAAFGIWQALRTGMRCGEVCAVRPRDVYQARGYVHVGGNVVAERGRAPARREKTKTPKSRRNISLADSDLERYRDHMRWCAGTVPGFGKSSPLVGPEGAWVSPDALSEAFRRLRGRLGLSRAATFHTLRHTHASWCLAEGVDLITLSERLGHADSATTARIYGHMIRGRDRAAAEAFDALYTRLQGTSMPF